MNDLIHQLAGEKPYDPDSVAGYTKSEIEKIELLYDIQVNGDLRDFLLEMGRCDGGLTGDEPIILYRPAWSMRAQLMTQIGFFTALQELGKFEFLAGKPFVFSIEGETQYFFVRTAADVPNRISHPGALELSTDPNRVYHYDENNGTVNDTGISFLEYMKRTVREWGGRSQIVCRGELLVV